MSTPHIKAEMGDFAPVVLMPGDPVRAKYIADNYLHGVKEVNNVRGMLAFTGFTLNHKKVSVMASGMGVASMGIYSEELFNSFGVKLIIRVGTCGAYQPQISLGDIILVSSSSTDSNWPGEFNINGTFAPCSDFIATNVAYTEAKKLDITPYVGNVLSSDIFYEDDATKWKKWAKYGTLAVEMETYSLYFNALKHKKKALTILSVTDQFATNKHMTAEERVNLDNLFKIAIATAEKFSK